jgi:hypothetical protein
MSTHVWRRIEDVGNDEEENIEEVVVEGLEMSTTGVVVVDGDGSVEEEEASLMFNLTIL